MCILFLHINPKPTPGKFRLILAANRDEAYRRPTKSADYWEEDGSVIGGRDLEPGKEGGSWLASSTRGRMAALLNIMRMGEHPPELLGRGSLVSEFVKGKQSGHEYLKSIALNSHKYRPFNFLTIEVRPETINVCEYCNVGEHPKPISVTNEYVGIGNSFLDEPFVKVTEGVSQFREIVDACGNSKDKKTLHNKLLDFLKGDKRHFPDTVMMKFAPHVPPNDLKLFSSVYVKIPQRGYGTRAHTIITVDENNNADFSEWSMKEPIDPENPHWESTHFSNKITFSSP